MRQTLGKKKIAFYKKKTGLPVVGGMVRGDTDHRVDLLLEDGLVAWLYKNGEIEIDSRLRWTSKNKE